MCVCGCSPVQQPVWASLTPALSMPAHPVPTPPSAGVDEECAPGCPYSAINNGVCTASCQAAAACHHDGQDCVGCDAQRVLAAGVGGLPCSTWFTAKDACITEAIKHGSVPTACPSASAKGDYMFPGLETCDSAMVKGARPHVGL